MSLCILLGVNAIAVLKTDELLIGTGGGMVCRASQIEVSEVQKDAPKILPSKKPSSNKKKAKVEIKLKELE